MNLAQLAEEPRITAVQLAGSLPRNPRFREWCGPEFGFDASNEKEAAQLIRSVCWIDSRRDLATNVEAAQRFDNLIRKPFVEWCEQQQQPA